MYSIVLSRGLNLLYVACIGSQNDLLRHCNSTVGFVIFFSTFLIGCIDYKRIPAEGNGRLSDVVIDNCVSKCASTVVYKPFSLHVADSRASPSYSSLSSVLSMPGRSPPSYWASLV